jgi:hypothetical protein
MRQDGITILVGTTKGAFLISGGNDGQRWTVKGPFCGGWPINHVIGDPVTGLLWAGGGGEFHGAGVWRSEDMGATWEVTKLTKGQVDDWAANDPQLAAMMNWSNQPLPFADQFSQIWSLAMPTGHYTPEQNRQDSFRVGTAARVGKKFKACETILLPAAGILAGPAWFYIRFCSIQRTPKNSGSGFRRPASLRQRMAAEPGIVAIDCQMRNPALNTPTRQRPATAKSDIASTT